MHWTVRVMTFLLLTGTATAQSPGAVFVGGFGQWTHFDSKWDLDSGLGSTWGWGARVGVFISPSWNLEGDGSYTPANSRAGTSFLGSTRNGVGGDVKASTFTARAVYHFPSTGMRSFHFGAGGVLENFRGANDGAAKVYQLGVNAIGGINLAITPAAALRVDGIANFYPSNGVGFDFGAQVGLQLSQVPRLFGPPASPSLTGAPYAWLGQLDMPLSGTVELGGSLQTSRFDNNGGRAGVSPENSIGFSARVGVFLSNPRWEIEADGYYTPADARLGNAVFARRAARPTEANGSAIAARLLYNAFDTTQTGRRSEFIIGAGVVRTNTKFVGGIGAGNINDTYHYNLGLSGLAGMRFHLANRIAARVDGIFDWMPRNKPSGNINAHLRGGLSFLLGGARSEVMVTPAPTPQPPPPPPPPPPSS